MHLSRHLRLWRKRSALTAVLLGMSWLELGAHSPRAQNPKSARVATWLNEWERWCTRWRESKTSLQLLWCDCEPLRHSTRLALRCLANCRDIDAVCPCELRRDVCYVIKHNKQCGELPTSILLNTTACPACCTEMDAVSQTHKSQKYGDHWMGNLVYPSC